jgi:hypothetical protein
LNLFPPLTAFPTGLSETMSTPHGTRTRAPRSAVPRRHVPSSRRENLRTVFPLLLLGGTCFVLSLFLFQAAGAFHPSRIPLWLLSASIGVVATIGGTTGLIAGDFSENDGEGGGLPLVDDEAFVVVPRTEWEELTTRLASVTTGSGGRAEPARDRSDESGEGRDQGLAPLWEESVFRPEDVRRAGRASRATDRLAEQVDELVRELDLAEESSASVDRTGREFRTERLRASGAAVAGSERARREYEELLGSLTAQAEVAVRSDEATLACSRCHRPIDAGTGWEACTQCWRTYCADCLTSVHAPGGPLVCPGCGSTR